MTLIRGLSADPALAPLRRLDQAADRVVLTFDDGPDPDYTPKILDALRQAGVTATFFVIASEALNHPRIIHRTLAEGHSIGSHGWIHRHPWLQTANTARKQVEAASYALAELIGRQVRWFRPPHGALRPSMRQAAAKHDQRIVLWSKSALDWGPWATAASVTRRLQVVAGGDIVLMHDGRNRHNRPELVLQALPEFVSYLADHRLRAMPLR
ncbi:MAG: polysaccharide deacetylase family protein [Wenzhouxiangella sp.]